MANKKTKACPGNRNLKRQTIGKVTNAKTNTALQAHQKEKEETKDLLYACEPICTTIFRKQIQNMAVAQNEKHERSQIRHRTGWQIVAGSNRVKGLVRASITKNKLKTFSRLKRCTVRTKSKKMETITKE